MKYTKYETCAILHRFHILYISCCCNSKIELPQAVSPTADPGVGGVQSQLVQYFHGD